MSRDALQVSVVIPTHNRLAMLRRCLAALIAQDYPREALEIVVVADGCTDGTAEATAGDALPGVRVFSQPSSGAAAARNRGAREAAGDILLFIDDDVIASPGLVAAHAERHRHGRGIAVIGPYVPDLPKARNYWLRSVHLYWRNTFDEIGRPGHIPTYRDVLSGNLSLRREAFARVGGFDDAFPSCGIEDYELGIRLLGAGIEPIYAREAAGLHLDTTDLGRSFRRKYQEGQSTLLLLERHPSVLATTPLGSAGIIARFALTWRGGARGVVSSAPVLLSVAERLGLRPVWRTILTFAHSVEFWRGVRDAVGGGYAGFRSTLERVRRAGGGQS